MGVEWIRGAQAQGVIANVKHFAVNNQEGVSAPTRTVAGSRYKVDARDERTLVELYLPQFEACQAGPRRLGDVLLQPPTARTARAGGF